MKITESQLRQMIREESKSVQKGKIMNESAEALKSMSRSEQKSYLFKLLKGVRIKAQADNLGINLDVIAWWGQDWSTEFEIKKINLTHPITQHFLSDFSKDEDSFAELFENQILKLPELKAFQKKIDDIKALCDVDSDFDDLVDDIIDELDV